MITAILTLRSTPLDCHLTIGVGFARERSRIYGITGGELISQKALLWTLNVRVATNGLPITDPRIDYCSPLGLAVALVDVNPVTRATGFRRLPGTGHITVRDRHLSCAVLNEVITIWAEGYIVR